MTTEIHNHMKEVVQAVEVLPDDCWRDLFDLAMPDPIKKHAYFAREGEYPTDLAFVGKGIFRAFFRTADGAEYNKTFFTEGSFMIALASVVTGNKNVINIQALEDAAILRFNYQRFAKLFDRYQPLERLARRVIELEWVKKEVREIRLVLNNATERYEFFQKEHPGLENRIPQYHIASYLGITPIQLSRIRSKLNRR